jgi:protein-serine/threonine kinase
MTQFFSSLSPSPKGQTEKGDFATPPMSSKHTNGPSHFPQKFKNFFRINSLGSNASTGSDGNSPSSKPEGRSFRQSRFLGITRNRSVTVNSEGNALLDDAVSPTAHANPYFTHQGLPSLRHHNEGSVPPSPPDTPPATRGNGISRANDQATTAGKEELARKLRRVASAPNAQGFFSSSGPNERPKTAELGKDPLVQDETTSTLGLVSPSKGLLSPNASPSGIPTPGQIREAANFRRTYSSNSIKVRNVEVGPSSFDKIKMIGKGDVGKVYLVREKKSSRLYAMKGLWLSATWSPC